MFVVLSAHVLEAVLCCSSLSDISFLVVNQLCPDQNTKRAMDQSKPAHPTSDDASEYVKHPLMAIQSWMQHTERELKTVRSDLDAHRQFQFQYNSNDQLHNRLGHVRQITVDIRSEMKNMQAHLQDVSAKVHEVDMKLEQQSNLLRQLLAELAHLRSEETQPIATQVINDD